MTEISNDELFLFMEKQIVEHEKYLSFVPCFWRENVEMIERMLETEVISSQTDGHDLIEGFLNSRPDFFDGTVQISLLDGRWRAEYNYIREVWVFTKALDYEMIRSESYALEEVIKGQLKKRISDMGPENFEYLLFEIFEQLEEYGAPIKRPQTRDGGYEMVVTRPHRITGSTEHILVQAKMLSGRVSVSQVRELIGSLDVVLNTKAVSRVSGLMVSLNGETADARKDAERSSYQIDFLELDDLVNILYRERIGWMSRDLRFASLDESFWSEWSDGDE